MFKNIHNRLKEVECSSGREKDDKGRKDSARSLIKFLVESQQFTIFDSDSKTLVKPSEVDETQDYN